LTLDLLEWVATCPRAYGETIEVWRSSCPRLTIWEDALHARLVRIVRSSGGSHVELTEAGRAAVSHRRPTV
jgi:hypothetical protein